MYLHRQWMLLHRRYYCVWALNWGSRVLQLPQAVELPASTETQHTGCNKLTGGGFVTSWSSWRSFTVTLLWGSDWVPLGNTPSLVITTGWRTLKSRAMADASEGASIEGSDTLTISISASWPATGREGWQRLLHRHTSNVSQSQHADRVFPGMKTEWFGLRANIQRRRQTLVKLHSQHFETLVLGTARLQSELLLVSVVS